MVTKKKHNISFRPKNVTKKLLRDLKDRAGYVVTKRFGLDNGIKKTLESIGSEYGITRERVRQIENFALSSIRKSESFEEAREIFDELKSVIDGFGGVVSEDFLLDHLTDDPVYQNHILLYLVLCDEFKKHKEDTHFKTRWISNRSHAEAVHDALRDIHSSMKHDTLLSEREVIGRMLDHDKVCQFDDCYKDDHIVKNWLNVSKAIASNSIGDWGPASSPNIKVRGVRDYAYLVMRKHGSPMHFKEVADEIQKVFGRDTHVATTHNELIKDDRFILVGRGIYALLEWGYKRGVVREVIEAILEEEGPMHRDEIIERVLKERYLKRNTILVNLQNQKYFVRGEDGKYNLVSA